MRIALLADKPNWAFHRIAKQVRANAPKDLKIDIFFSQHLSLYHFFRNEACNYDLVHVFWRPDTIAAPTSRPFALTTAIYDHLYINNSKLNERIFRAVDGIYCSSMRLNRIYKDKYKIDLRVCADGVDITYFKNPTLRDFDKAKLRIGWVGNSKAISSDHKGLTTVVRPLMDMIKAKNMKCDFVFADSASGGFDFAAMPQFYWDIDIFLCTSISEGTPNPILEASASGTPWISTDVGIVPELAGNNQSHFIVNRSPFKFFEALEYLLENRKVLTVISDENQFRVQGFSWEILLRNHFQFFSEALFSFNSGRSAE